jgi:hypothetical protein
VRSGRRPQQKRVRSRLRRFILGLQPVLVVVCLMLIPLPASPQISTSPEYRAKANFLANFSMFVDWPVAVFDSPQSPFLICVFGDFSFGTSLAESTHGIDYRGRRIEVRWVHKEAELSACQILFVSRGDSRRYAKVFDAIRDKSVLTVGETPSFMDAGGAVSFVFQPESPLQFEVNLEAVESAHLKMSSRLLALARRVVNKTLGAKT